MYESGTAEKVRDEAAKRLDRYIAAFRLKYDAAVRAQTTGELRLVLHLTDGHPRRILVGAEELIQ